MADDTVLLICSTGQSRFLPRESTDAPHKGHSGHPPETEIQKPDEQWRHELTRQQYDVLRRARTEPAFTGKYVHAKENGSYCCAGCGNELFRSDAKFASGTGWPSFYEPSPRPSSCARTTACLCAARRWSAAAAAVIWAMSSATGRPDRPALLHQLLRAGLRARAAGRRSRSGPARHLTRRPVAAGLSARCGPPGPAPLRGPSQR